MTDPVSQLAATPMIADNKKRTERADTWFQAFASAWGRSLDQKAEAMIASADGIRAGTADKPSDIAQLTAQSLEFTYMSQAQNTSVTSVGEAMKTSPRKQ